MKSSICIPFLFFLCTVHVWSQEDRPNVLFICVDDLNDWTGYLAGHPQALTPNLDQLAKNGLTFTRAYCAAPSCNPSRAAIMTGIRPSTSGIYTNPQPWRNSPVLSDIRTIPQYFREHGYVALGSGKVFHGRYPDPISWDSFWPSLTKQRPDDPVPTQVPVNGIANTRHFDWGPVQAPKEEMGDWQVADWVIDQLDQEHSKPFFLACGFYRPHLPWYAPQAYFDRFPIEEITLPKILENDLDDIPDAGIAMINFKDHEKVLAHNQWKKAVQGYLASISFMDECLGRVLKGLETSKYAKNTILVLWSDHGWNLGEKQKWRKFALWENTTHTNCIFTYPGMDQVGKKCEQPINLIDLYPTLLELCELPTNALNEGTSLVPLLQKPDMQWLTPSITTYRPNNHAIRLADWRYIQYADGSEELYDLSQDPHEWVNLAGDRAYQAIKTELSKSIPQVNAASVE